MQDVKSYMNVGIPQSRIFTVNHKGILKHELSLTFQSRYSVPLTSLHSLLSPCSDLCTLYSPCSYSSLTGIVDSQFPPLRCRAPSLHLPSCSEGEGEGEGEEEEVKEEFSTFNYWRTPIDFPLDLPDIT